MDNQLELEFQVFLFAPKALAIDYSQFDRVELHLYG